MKIKTKLTLGVGLLFLMILLLSAIGEIYINALKSDTENILVDNYNSLVYANKMLASLEENASKSLLQFEENLKLQENNISEIGEKETTQTLRINYNQFLKNGSVLATKQLIRKEIFKIIDLNMSAIQRKSEFAKRTAEVATLRIALTGVICFLIAFTLLINLPSNIANPIKELTESIKQIAAKNYSQRVHFSSNNEFGELAKSFNTMAEKLEEYNDSNLSTLMIEKKRIETLINNMHDPVIGLDESMKIIFVNEEATKMIGLPHYELVGEFAQNLAFRNDLIRSLMQDITIPKTNNKRENAEMIKIFANNKESYFEKESHNILIIPTGEQTKKTIGFVVILRNITQYKELDFAKTNFIATVSHEFKTPIFSIKMSLQLLENERVGQLNEEQRNLLKSIKDDTQRLLNTTSELLNITQVETGNIQLSIVPADPKSILTYAINANKTQAEQKQIQLQTHYKDNLPEVLADSEKTAWVLINLISNAIRYSHDNSTIILSIIADNQQIRYVVKDFGQGIAPQYKDKVFDRYFRVPGTKKEGTGLGLAISKEFIEVQGGQISVESDFGSGSIFTVTLQLA
ncbi:ATP-binding protein [Arcicella sp. LKC2W]|uniref:ATP-binding protein n=1 Tax=Arcicella sp. LKC2W TaxID=2984198 RepID=UPI002B2199E7|nr:ATP-binding protein [Arcicella sp. LKC2W]MEA5461136.1 ATP-binding protein [Arcicella sp. LKC2W]